MKRYLFLQLLTTSVSANPFLTSPPTGIARCCLPNSECLTSSHCVVACLTSGAASIKDECKNCMCWNAAQNGCCAENYVCSSTQPTIPLTGTCTPYCTPDPTSGKICSGHGSCTAPSTCKCDIGWDDSSDCSTCEMTNYGPTCEACPSNTEGAVCSGHGDCDGAGTTSGDGTCTCNVGWVDGNKGSCSQCADGYGPPGECTSFVCTQTCQHGSCSAPNVCTCQEGWSGVSCDTTSCADISIGPDECSGNGKCISPDVCSCNLGYQGLGCEIGLAECCATVSCSDNPKQCNTCCQYPPHHHLACANAIYQCKGCDCGVTQGKGTQGCCGDSYCQSSDDDDVDDDFVAHGFLKHSNKNDPTYHCCPTSRAGKDCKDCASGYYGDLCIPCPGGTPVGSNHNPCSGHGLCIDKGGDQGTCKCVYGYTGDGCSQCMTDKFKCDNNCNGHGICTCPPSSSTSTSNSTKGYCQCEPGYDSADCNTCSNGYWMGGSSSSCVKCSGCPYCDKTTGKCITQSPSPNSPNPPRPTPTPPGGSGHKTVGTYILYGISGGFGCLLIGTAFLFVTKKKKKVIKNRNGSEILLHNPHHYEAPPAVSPVLSTTASEFPDLPDFPEMPPTPDRRGMESMER